MSDQDWQDDQEDSESVSKTQIKNEMHELQALAKRLLTLNAEQLKQLPLTDRLEAAIEEASRIKSNEATRRHMQFLGRLMREADHEAIRHGIDLLDPSSEAFARVQQQIERWRDRLLTGSQEELSAFLDQYPNADRQHLRQLIRNSSKEQAKAPDQWSQRKKLFQYIKALSK